MYFLLILFLFLHMCSALMGITNAISKVFTLKWHEILFSFPVFALWCRNPVLISGWGDVTLWDVGGNRKSGATELRPFQQLFVMTAQLLYAYRNCDLRFDIEAKLQRIKLEILPYVNQMYFVLSDCHDNVCSLFISLGTSKDMTVQCLHDVICWCFNLEFGLSPFFNVRTVPEPCSSDIFIAWDLLGLWQKQPRKWLIESSLHLKKSTNYLDCMYVLTNPANSFERFYEDSLIQTCWSKGFR